MQWSVVQIQPGDQRLDEVIGIWGPSRSTLGLFPRGAFADCARQGRLAVAVDAANCVVGYLAFRIQRRLNSAAIIHLCVREANRGTGVADALADWLKDHARRMSLSSLRLKCRRDYHAEGLWQRLGFVARGDVLGRGQNGEKLTVWVHSLGPIEDLFSLADSDEDGAKLVVAIDASIFFDLHGDQESPDCESLVLLEPWVDDAVKLHVVDELHNEINRNRVAGERDLYHRLAAEYPEIQYDSVAAIANVKVVDEILGKVAESENEKSDRQQLARAAAGNADIFLTRDRELIKAADDIDARLGIKVMYPSELSGRLDETERGAAYQPAQLFSTPFTRCPVRAADVDAIVERVLLSRLGEKPNLIASSIRQHLTKIRSNPQSELELVREPDGSIAAFVVHVRGAKGEDGVIAFFRIARTRLERTLARHLLLHAIQCAASEDRPRLVVEDKFLTPLVVEALLELGFNPSECGWVRHTPKISGPRADLLAMLGRIGMDTATIESAAAGDIEAKLWPAKLYGENIGCYVVPIAPNWAAQLFDSKLAAEDLFGAFAHLALNRENVYYRKVKNGSFALPGRILWYVKKKNDLPGTMAIRACSRLLSVEVDSAKTLYGRHRRIGVYEWREVKATANGDPRGKIMALRFADTEQFQTPIAVPALRDLGITSTFQSPTRISEDQFAHIYRIGMMCSNS